MDRALLNFLASPGEREISLGEVKGVLRLLPAAKLLEIRRKLTEFSADEQEQAMLGDAMWWRRVFMWMGSGCLKAGSSF